MRFLKNKTVRFFLFFFLFISAIVAFFAGIAFTSSYQMFSGKVVKDKDYQTSDVMMSYIEDNISNTLYAADAKSSIKKLDFDKETLELIDGSKIKDGKNTYVEKISYVDFLKNPKINVTTAELLSSYISDEEKTYIDSIPEVEDSRFVKLSWDEYEKMIKNNSFPFSWNEYESVSSNGDIEITGELVSYDSLPDEKKEAYELLHDAVSDSYISGNFSENDHVVYYDGHVLLYSSSQDYIYQNNQTYHNGFVFYINNEIKKNFVYIPYPDEDINNNDFQKSLLTSRVLTSKSEVCVAGLDSEKRSTLEKRSEDNYIMSYISSCYSFDGKVADDITINSNEFGRFPYIEGDKDHISYNEVVNKLRGCSDIFISYDSKSGELEQWYINDAGVKTEHIYIDQKLLEQYKAIADCSFVVTVDLNNSHYIAMEHLTFNMCKVIPVPALMMVIGIIIFIVVVVLITIGEPAEMCSFDKIPYIFDTAFVVGVIALMGTLAFGILDTWEFVMGAILKDSANFWMSFLIIALFTYLVCAAVYLSIVRRIKCNKFLDGFITYKILRRIYGNFGDVVDRMKGKTRLFISIILFLSVNLGCVMGLYSYSRTGRASFLVFITVITDLYIAYRVSKYLSETEEILKVTHAIENGDFDAKLDTSRLSYNNIEIGKSVNNLGQGLAKALESSVRDEKTKAELITNVSHDIKTPLTSIINYVDLLKRENIDNPKAVEYINVIDKKSDRLKQLILDLIEASKTSTGNIELEKINMNIVELMGQVVGEYEEKFAEKNLELVQSFPEDRVVINGDGRRIFRIIDNVMNNIYKYAQTGTRVYVEMSKIVKDGVEFVSVDFKNVSSQMLNISPEELMERFVRGDESRSTEGSGLGLSIAKNLTDLHDGHFNIEIDGDLFKVSVQFPVVSETETEEQE